MALEALAEVVLGLALAVAQAAPRGLRLGRRARPRSAGGARGEQDQAKQGY